MPEQPLLMQTWPNGLTLLAEPMEHVRSATMHFLIPSGFCYDPEEMQGISTVLCEMLLRGAGSRNSQELALTLDNLGADRNEGVGPFNIILSAGSLGRNLLAILEVYADIIRRPHLPAEELHACQELALQDLLGLEDSPQEKAILALKRRYYPPPLNRNSYGQETGILAVTAEKLRAHYERFFQPQGAILAVAGNIDWHGLVQHVERLFGDWRGEAPQLTIASNHYPESTHLMKQTQQTQIALAFPSAPFVDPDYYAAQGTVRVLSGGMSARLFTEVREKRGLCYSIYATYDSVKDRAAILCYAGTRAEKAQETLNVTVAELRRLRAGVSDDEIERVKVGLKSALIMNQESTAARASSIASDWFYLGRVRSFDEISAAIHRLSPRMIQDYLERFPVEPMTLVTLGPEPLTMPG